MFFPVLIGLYGQFVRLGTTFQQKLFYMLSVSGNVKKSLFLSAHSKETKHIQSYGPFHLFFVQ